MQIFSPFHRLSFLFVDIFFSDAEDSEFDALLISYVSFCCLYLVLSNKSFVRLMSVTCFLVISSRNFMVSGLMLKSLLYFASLLFKILV